MKVEAELFSQLPVRSTCPTVTTRDACETVRESECKRSSKSVAATVVECQNVLPT